MCGIAGSVGWPESQAVGAVEAMCDAMRTRGPDGRGVETFGDGVRVALGNTRLAIVDASPAGHQPMTDPERGTTLVYNGMLYNFRALRAALEREGERFNSSCDTEVVLRAYGRWGVRCVERLHGMFAFALWDSRSGELLLARDRLGIKPLYYRHDGDRLVFASQVKALVAGGLVAPNLSAEGIRSYLSFGAVSEPLTAVAGVFSLPAGHTALVRDGRVNSRPYWELGPRPGEECEDASATLRALLEQTVDEHLVSDAALGVFLSGGLDSSLLAAVAARVAPGVRTISVGFDEPGFGEARYMELVARRIESDHIPVTLSAGDLLGWLPDAFRAMDQPTFDGINTFAVSRVASRAGLKVAVSGLGADELFDGYGYVRRARALERLRVLPRPLAPVARAAARLGGVRPDKLHFWLSSGSVQASSYELLRRVYLPDEVSALIPSARGAGVSASPGLLDPSADLYGQLTALDLGNYTRNVLLRDTDAMSMANSLEVRVPYLDDRFVEHVLALPAAAKRSRKALLADAARDLLPREVLARRKQGFVLPLARWMRSELRDEVDRGVQNVPGQLAEIIDRRALSAMWEREREGAGWTRAWTLFALCRWAQTLEEAA